MVFRQRLVVSASDRRGRREQRPGRRGRDATRRASHRRGYFFFSSPSFLPTSAQNLPVKKSDRIRTRGRRGVGKRVRREPCPQNFALPRPERRGRGRSQNGP